MKVVVLVSRYSSWKEYGIVLQKVMDEAEDLLNITNTGDIVWGDVTVLSWSHPILKPALLDGIQFRDPNIVQETES